MNTDNRYTFHIGGATQEVIHNNGYIPFPSNWDIIPTLRCNLNCSFCYIPKGKRDELSTESWYNIYDKFNMKGSIIKFIGGEVFVRKDINKLVGGACNRGASVIIATNGLKPDKELLLSDAISEITTSLDGPEEIHNKMRGGNPNAYKSIVDLIKTVGPKKKLNITCVISGGTIKHIEHVLRFREYVNAIRFQVENFLYPWEKEEVPKAIPINIQVKEESGYTLNDLENVLNVIPKWAFTQPKYLRTDWYDCFAHQNRRYSSCGFGCVYMFRGRIEPNGDMSFCPFIKKTFGNVLKQDPKDIWNSVEMRSFRVKMISHNFLPVCENCCSSRILKRKLNI